MQYETFECIMKVFERIRLENFTDHLWNLVKSRGCDELMAPWLFVVHCFNWTQFPLDTVSIGAWDPMLKLYYYYQKIQFFGEIWRIARWIINGVTWKLLLKSMTNILTIVKKHVKWKTLPSKVSLAKSWKN